MRFGIVSDPYKDPENKVLRLIGSKLKSLDVETVYPGGLSPAGKEPAKPEKPEGGSDPWDGVDLAISVGGDGTFLRACHEVYKKQIPLIGVNLGQMGFMTEIEAEDLMTALERLADGDYRLKKRLVLDITVYDEKGNIRLKSFALNDAVLYRGHISRIIPCTFTLNGTKIETIPSDGLIVAGPTGSTGYALACGGPIIDPELDLMLLTPISPHTLHNRSYVMAPDSLIEIGIEKGYPFKPILSVDGRTETEVGTEDRVIIRKADLPMLLANLDDLNFFKRLPDKINARGKAR